PHTLVIPKSLMNVGGKPIIDHILAKAMSSGIEDFAFIIGYKGDEIRDYIEANYSFNCRFYVQEKMLGLAYAVRLASDYLTDDPVLIILGDTIFDTDLDPVFKTGISSLGVQKVDDPRRFGTVELNNDGVITRLVEKPQNPRSNLAIVGLYYIEKGAILKDCIDELLEKKKKTAGEFQITDALQIMIERGETIRTFPVHEWCDCGKPETILSTNHRLLSKRTEEISIPGSLVRSPVFIDPTSEIEHSIIGPSTTVARNAQIRNSIIFNSIVGENAKIADSILRDSIIGNHSHISGTLKSLNISDYSDISF
ncbi:sugar nucleotidyltransferase, partial [candidate division KSB1 bacterium]